MVDTAHNPAIEQQLIERALAKESGALERLLVLHHDRLARELAYRLPASLRASVGIEDVIQDAYVSVFKKVDEFRHRGPGSFYAWLATIAERKLFDAIKARQTKKRGGDWKQQPQSTKQGESVVEWLEVLAVHERTPSRSAAGREAIFVVQEALDSLKADYREAVRLRYIEGLPVAETAQRMKRSEGAVTLLCHRGLKRMEETLKRYSAYLSFS